MEIADFPRPPDDNGRGVHWSARVYHPTGRDLDFWIGELTAMHIKWVKLLDDGDGSSLELCQRLLDAGIMPVVRLFRERPNPGRIGGREISGLRKLIGIGVRYFETNNEPDLPAEWKDNHKPANWLDIVVENFIYDADIVISEGGLPAIPAMGPGGRDNIVQRIVEAGRDDLLRKGAWLAIHNYTLNHPLDYPDDPVNQEGKPLTREEYERFPAWAWDNRSMEQINERRARDKNPGQTLAEDANCFRGWERAGQMVLDAAGFHIPVISTEGGPVVGWGDDLRYPKVTPDQQAEWQLAITRFLQEDAPEWYFTCCTWLLASRPLGDWNPTWDQMSWYTDAWNERFGLAGQLPIVQALKDLPSVVRPELRRGEASLVVHLLRASDGQPLAMAPVVLEELGQTPGASRRRLKLVTDDAGRLEVTGLPADAYRLLVFNAELSEFDLAEHEQKHLELRVSAGRRSRVWGRVTDVNGVPQQGLVVALHQSSPPRLLAQANTDVDGGYEFDELAAGAYVLRVAPGTVQATEIRDITVDGWEAEEVNVTTPPAPTLRYQVVRKRLLTPEETGNDNKLFGQVLDTDGSPLDGVVVRMRWTGAAPDTRFPTVRSGQDPFKPRGYFEFIHTPGVFLLDVVDEEYESEVAEDLVTANMPGRSRPISYEVIFQRKPVVHVQAQSRISGEIPGGPAGATVMLSGAGVEPQVRRLDAERRFRFTELPAGVYQVSLEGIGIIGEDITLNGFDSVDIEFPMLGQIHGQVLPAQAGETVRLTCETFSLRIDAVTDDTGAYQFLGLPADTYTLTLLDSPLSPRKVECNGRDAVTGILFDRRSAAQSALHGRISDHQGEPVARQIVWLRNVGERVAETQTDAAGAYRFDNLAAGVYGLETPDFGLVAQGIRVDGVSDVEQDVQLPPPAAGSVQGRLEDAAGSPVGGEPLLLVGPTSGQVATEPDGSFRFTALAPGDYVLRVARAPDVKARLTLAPGETRNVLLRLPQPEEEESDRFLSHYVLLTGGDSAMIGAKLAAAMDYILSKAATVGYDPRICTRAHEVTIIGDVEPQLLQELENASIPVHRVNADPARLREELEALQ